MTPNRQPALDQRKHIPQHIEQAMNQHMQQSLPAHLKKYVGSDKPAYIPQHAEKAIAQHMEKAMPAHLKAYSGAYMQQRIVKANAMRATGASPMTRPGVTPAPMPDKLRLGHSMPSGEQHNATWAQAIQPEQPQAITVSPTGDFDFIMNSAQQSQQRRLPGGNSSAMRALFVVGGLTVLLIVFIILKNILAGGSNLPSFISVAQDQQALIHLSTTASQEHDLNTTNQNFAATAQLSLTSAQADLITYLKKNHQKISPKQLNAKVSTKTDQQLVDAKASATYNKTFQSIMQTKLTTYMDHLHQTYKQSKGKNARTLLTSDYDQAQLLLNQLVAVPN